jgi:methyl-accepting chemotaxis protein
MALDPPIAQAAAGPTCGVMYARDPLPPPRPGQPWLTALALLLGLLAALAALALSRHGDQDERLAELHDRTLPAVRVMHQLAQQVEQVRGLEALHLLLTSPAELTAVETQIAAHRAVVADQLAAFDRLVVDDTDRRHLGAVRSSLGAFWQAQDGVLVASRQAVAADGGGALRLQARERLTGPSQQAYSQVVAALATWSAYREQRAAERASQAAAAQAWLRRALVALTLGLALLAVGAVAAWLRARRTLAADVSAAPSPAAITPTAAMLAQIEVANRQLGALLQAIDGRAPVHAPPDLAAAVAHARAGAADAPDALAAQTAAAARTLAQQAQQLAGRVAALPTTAPTE